MQCSFPKRVPNVDHLVPCQRCCACRINKTSMWATRLMLELPYWDKACFITLTYDDEHLPVNGSLDVEEMKNFWKRVRKNTGAKIKYYYCGEYGDELLRCHYHAVVFGLDFAPWIQVGQRAGRKIYTSELLQRCWQDRGFVTVSDVTYDSCAYVAGYVQKKLYGKGADFYVSHHLVPPFAHQSNGISLQYVEDHADQLVDNLFVWQKGHRAPLPRYVTDKLGLNEKDPFTGESFMSMYAKEIIQKRLDHYLNSDLVDRFKTKGPNGPLIGWFKYVRECGIQREIELSKRLNQ